jgi:catechol 2,3-dioxygenase-like lactoylglutathione lyase family enzyme
MTQPAASPFVTGHVGLNVADLGRSIAFYQQVFGFELKGRSDQTGRAYAFLGNGDTLVLTLWQQSSGQAIRDRPGLHHLSFQVPSLAAVKAAEEQVRAAGATIHHGGIVPHREGATSGGLFFEDPDGIRLEIFAPDGAGVSAAPHGHAPTCGFF